MATNDCYWTRNLLPKLQDKNFYESAWSKSAITSFTVSNPNETRTKPSAHGLNRGL
jgi:hypothetical protein